MSSAAEPVELYVGLRECWRAGTATTPEARRFDSPAAALEGMGSSSRGRLRVWLSGALARPFLVGPIAGLRRRREALEAARAVAGALAGSGALEVVLEGWPGQKAALAIASPSATMVELGALCVRLRLRTAFIRPWWCRVLEAMPQATQVTAVAIEDGDALTILRDSGSEWLTARTYHPKPATDQLAQAISRLALSEGIAAEEIVVARWDPTLLLHHAGRAGAPA